jgi:hypothetical protein
MLVDAAWTMYQMYVVKSHMEASSNLRPSLVEVQSLISEIEAMNCSAARFVSVKILVALSSSILHRNSTRIFSNGREWMSPEAIRELCVTLPSAELMILCSGEQRLM